VALRRPFPHPRRPAPPPIRPVDLAVGAGILALLTECSDWAARWTWRSCPPASAAVSTSPGHLP